MFIDLPREEIIYSRESVDWLLIEWVRQASNVSLEFRRELAETFWQRTLITSGSSPDFSTGECLPKWLQDRPSIHAGIKYVNLNLDLLYSSPRKERLFLNFFDSISAKLNLETLEFDIDISEADIHQLSSL
jgi:hypothetical protein